MSARIDDACAVPGGSSTHSPAPKDRMQDAQQDASQMDESHSDDSYKSERADLSDPIREFWIRWFGRRIECAMRKYAETGCFSHRGDADRWRLRMEGLIRGRSHQQVARMEAAQAERMAAEPGAERESA